MKDKLVLWGKNAEGKKTLLGIELIATDNMVKIHQFPGDKVTEEFYQLLLDQWKSGKEVSFIDEVITLERPLSVTDDLLPEDIKVEKTDLINRAKTEWHFTVLSSKLFELYQGEVQDIKEKVDEAQVYSAGLWEEAKGFWNKVQTQINEKNLFRSQANELKNTTNAIFDKLKKLRKALDIEYKEKSKKAVSYFNEKLAEINGNIESGKTLQPLFEELKNLQKEFSKATFVRDDRNKIWNAIDKSFKKLKEKKYGKQGSKSDGGTSTLSRVQNRYDGLLKAIERMNYSIEKDKRDKKRENAGIERSEGQLEAQLRQAKLIMIDERVNSKQLKLDDMLKTKAQLEAKIAKEKERAEKIKEKKEIQKIKDKKKEEIAQRIAEQSSEVIAENEEKLKQAAALIAAGQVVEKVKEVEKKPVKDTVKEEIVDQKPIPEEDSKKKSVEEKLEVENVAETPNEETVPNPEVDGNNSESEEGTEEDTVVEKTLEVIEDVLDNAVDAAKSFVGAIGNSIDKVVDSISEEE